MPHFISTRVLIIAKYKNIYNIYDIDRYKASREYFGWWLVGCLHLN